MKRDVVAAITFLMTGLLFYLAQAEEPSKTEISSEGGCSRAEAIMEGQVVKETIPDLVFQRHPTVWDS